MKTKEYTISVFTENAPGLLLRVTTVFTRRKLNIESITASESEIKGIHRYTIVLFTTDEMADIIVNQLEKQIEVYKAFKHTNEELVYQEIALYKIRAKSISQADYTEDIVRKFSAKVLSITNDYIVIEKTGYPEETKELYGSLQKYEILEFVRSGRVAITKPMKSLEEHLNEKENIYKSK
ncbi:MAG: acetolactate synthase small subunit [Bacteroidales bacterium]|nr:acetolactate synthase small subunit [Bacteroidales bacterium]